MKLSVIISAYNEAGTLAEALEKVMQVPLEKEIIVIDDGSEDATPTVLDAWRDRAELTVIRHDTNQGKGRAVRSALAHVQGDIVIIQDADLEYDPGDYPALIAPILRGESSVVYGARTGGRHLYLCYFLGGKLLSFLTNILYRQKLHDVSACYKAFAAGLLKSLPLRCERFEFDVEVTARIAKQGIMIPEVPVRYAPRTFEEGKKIRWTDGARALFTLLRYRLRS